MKGRKSRKWVIPVVVVVVIAAVVGFMALRHPRAAVATNAQQYETRAVTRGDLQVTVHGSGSLAPIEAQTVYTQTAGRVDNVLVENGDAVKKDQPLATLNGDGLADTIKDLKEQIVTQDAAIAAARNMTGSKTLTAPVKSRVKAIYTAVDEDVTRAMSADHALILLSTDGKMKLSFTPEQGVTVTPGQKVSVHVGKKKVDGFLTDIPDGTTNEAVAVIADDSFALNAKAEVYSKDGAKLGNGTLEANQPLLVTAYSGTVDHIYVDVGDKVSAGGRLLRLDGAILGADFEAQLVKRQQLQDDLDDAYADQANLTITAPFDGIVSDLTLAAGSSVPDGTAVCSVQDTSRFKLVVAADELDVPGIQAGQDATISIDALPNETATGKVVRVSSLGVKANDITTYDVTLEVQAPTGALANMTASADILVKESKNTLLVPVEAIVNEQGKSYVLGALPTDLATDSAGTGNRARRSQTVERPRYEVQTGLTNDSSVEILSGLNEGDAVAVPLAAGTSISDLFTGGGMGGGTRQGQAETTKAPDETSGG